MLLHGGSLAALFDARTSPVGSAETPLALRNQCRGTQSEDIISMMVMSAFASPRNKHIQHLRAKSPRLVRGM
jgi:hypothetical protein